MTFKELIQTLVRQSCPNSTNVQVHEDPESYGGNGTVSFDIEPDMDLNLSPLYGVLDMSTLSLRVLGPKRVQIEIALREDFNPEPSHV